VPEPKQVKNLIHIDAQAVADGETRWELRSSRVTEAVERLVAGFAWRTLASGQTPSRHICQPTIRGQGSVGKEGFAR
jgi:hypothetical protein